MSCKKNHSRNTERSPSRLIFFFLLHISKKGFTFSNSPRRIGALRSKFALQTPLFAPVTCSAASKRDLPAHAVCLSDPLRRIRQRTRESVSKNSTSIFRFTLRSTHRRLRRTLPFSPSVPQRPSTLFRVRAAQNGAYSASCQWKQQFAALERRAASREGLRRCCCCRRRCQRRAAAPDDVDNVALASPPGRLLRAPGRLLRVASKEDPSR